MITKDEFEVYTSPGFIGALERCIERDPVGIAMDRTLPYARELASRVKYLQKARTKLPFFYQARCIIPPRAYQQCTAESVASEKGYRGRLCVDLTCGLGVDSYAFSKGFEKVIAVEPDPMLAAVARHNFGLLGVRNVEVVENTAEGFLGENTGLHTDMVYVDPDRRTVGGKRVAALEDCSPEVTSLMPRLRQTAPRVVVKLSPLFDVHEAMRIFAGGTRVTAVSAGGECKELLVETGEAVSGQTVAARITGEGKLSMPYTGPEKPPRTTDIIGCRYLAVPDAALVKSGMAPRYYAGEGWTMNSPTGFAFGNEPLPRFASRIYRITDHTAYKPKTIRKMFKAKGVDRLNVLLRDFPCPVEEVVKQLGISQGGELWAALTTVADTKVLLRVEPLPR